MTQTLETIFEADEYKELNNLSNDCHQYLSEIKKMLVQELVANNYAEPLINYAKNLDLNDKYKTIRAKLDKVLLLSQSNYSDNYNLFVKENQEEKIFAMKSLLRKDLSSENLDNYLKGIEKLKNKTPTSESSSHGSEFYCKNGCDNKNIILNFDGLNVCNQCGDVKGPEYIFSEKRAYTSDEVQSRRRTEPIWRDYGPRTVIGGNHDSKNHPLTPKMTNLFNRLNKIQRSLVNSLERNYWEARPILNHLCSKLNLPETITETAWKIYCEVAKQKLTMGRSILGFVAASIYAGIKINKYSKSLDDIVEASSQPLRSVHKSLGLINLKVLPKLKLKYAPAGPKAYVYLFGNELKLSVTIQNKAVEIIKYSLNHGLKTIGKDPKGIAAAALYIASKSTDERKTQTEISECAQITEVTLRTRAKQIKNCKTKK